MAVARKTIEELKRDLPENRRMVELSDGQVVLLRAPGILFEERVFGKFPDLVKYHRDRERLQTKVDAGDAEQHEHDDSRDTALEFRLAIDLVCACSVEPRLVEDAQPKAGERYVDDLDPTDFWKVAAACNELWQDTRRGQATEVGPFAKGAGG